MEKHKILVVDDSADNADQILNFLKYTDKSFTFYQALNGKTACFIAEKKHPDLIITDWDMPEMDGIMLIKHLKAIESTKDIPIIMCTGVMTKTENLKTALDAGAIDYIRKPVEKLELIARVHSMLKLSDSIKKNKKQNIELLKQKQEIETNNKKLIELNATKDKFFGIIAHDLKSPFNGILGFSEMLKYEAQNLNIDLIAEYADNIYASVQHTFVLLENLLDWARMQQGRIPFEPQRILFNSIINAEFKVLKNSADQKNIVLIKNINENLIITADENMVSSVLRNLILNAIKFTPKGGEVKVEAKFEDNNIKISVSDTGIGIKQETIEKLFKIETSFTTLGTENEKGTGLGLLLCKEFIEKHDGKIWVESEVGEGSTFYFTLPYNAEPVKETVGQEFAISDKTDQVKKLKILIAEDDDVSEMLLDKTVKIFGKEILKAGTGVEAVEACKKNPDIDLVLMDIRMPEMGGHEATRRIREFNNDVVIIAQTAYGLSGDREKAIEAGCNDYVAKPIKRDELMGLIKKYFGS